MSRLEVFCSSDEEVAQRNNGRQEVVSWMDNGWNNSSWTDNGWENS